MGEVVDAKEAEGGDNEGRKASGSESSEESDDEDEEYEVESILQSRFVKKKKQYLVKWVNYSDEWNTWEPMENLVGSQDLVTAFEQKEAEKERKKDEARAALEAKKKANREKKEAEREAREAKRREEREKKSKSIIDTDSSDDEDRQKEPDSISSEIR